MEMENIKIYKEDLLDEIQVCAVFVSPCGNMIYILYQSMLKFRLSFLLFYSIQKLKLEIDNVMAGILSFESAEER